MHSLLKTAFKKFFWWLIERIDTVRNPKAVDFHFRHFWILQGIDRILKKHFKGTRLLRPRQISNFDEKVTVLISLGYNIEEAKEYIIIDESIKKGSFNKLESITDNNQGFIKGFKNKIYKQMETDNIVDKISIELCLQKLAFRKGKRNPKRDLMVMLDYINEIKNKDIAKKYKITPPAITQILKRNLSFLRECLSNQ